jgi:hypothetical protein
MLMHNVFTAERRSKMGRVSASQSASLLPMKPFQMGGARYCAHKPSDAPYFLKFMQEVSATLAKALEENSAMVTFVFGCYTASVGAYGCSKGWDLRNRVANVGRTIEWADPERRGRDAVEHFLATMYGLTVVGGGTCSLSSNEIQDDLFSVGFLGRFRETNEFKINESHQVS